MRGRGTAGIKAGAGVMPWSGVAWGAAQGEFGVEAWWPATHVDILVREVHTTVIPGIAVAAVAALHRHQRGFAGIGGGVFKERAGRVVLVLAADEGGKRGDAPGLAEALEERGAIAQRDVIAVAEGGAGGGVGGVDRGRVLEEFGVEEGKRFFEGVGFGSRNGPFDRGSIQPVGYQARDEEVDSVFQAPSVVSCIGEDQMFLGGRCKSLHRCRGRARKRPGAAETRINFILVLKLLTHVIVKLGRVKESRKFFGVLKSYLVRFWHHALKVARVSTIDTAFRHQH
jgi:hypothetical protein